MGSQVVQPSGDFTGREIIGLFPGFWGEFSYQERGEEGILRKSKLWWKDVRTHNSPLGRRDRDFKGQGM